MALSGSFNTSDYNGRYYTLSWSGTQDVANNRTKINWKISCSGGSSEWYAERDLILNINGSEEYKKTNRVERVAGEIASGSCYVGHNSDGTKTFSISLKAAVYVTTINCTGSKSFTLNNIARAATLTSASNFSSTSTSPTIYYSNPAGSSVTSLQACISLEGTNADIAYRDVPKSGIFYTFSLSDAEIKLLKNNTTGTSRKVTFILKTVIGGNTYTSKVVKTFTVNDDAPVITATIYDTNSAAIALTGSRDRLIKGISSAYVSATAKPDTGATIKTFKVTNGRWVATAFDKDINASFSIVESASFTLTATDSRGNTATTTVTKNWVDYVPLTCNFKGKIDSSGTLNYTVSGNYYNGAFGATGNTLTLKLFYGKKGEALTPLTLTPTISGNSYSYSGTITGLDYRAQYDIGAEAQDKLLTKSSADAQVMGTPVFDWSDEDFNFNVPVRMNDKTVLYENDESNNTVLAANGGALYLRPNGYDDTTGEVRISDTGAVEVSGDLDISSGDLEVAGSISADYAIISENSVQAPSIIGDTIQSNGNLNVKGSINLDYDLNCTNSVVAARVNAAGRDVGYSTVLHVETTARYMIGTHTINLTGAQRITNMHTGYIISWQLYKDGNIYSNNSNYTFVPKAVCNLNNGIITLPLMAEDGTTSGAKTLYITDDGTTTTIKGKDTNGTAPNNGWVIRRVIGF